MRASRRGMVDLIVMIVMIVFLLGMATLAFITYDKAQKERGYLAALREIPARQKSEIDTVKARYSELSSLIGFKGDADFTSPAQIEAMLNEGAFMIAEIYTAPAPTSEESARISGIDTGETLQWVYNKDAQDGRKWELKKVSGINKAKGTSLTAARLYNPDEVRALARALVKQDEVIHQLWTADIPNVVSQRKHQVTLRAQASSDRFGKSDEAYAATRNSIYEAERTVKGLNEETRQANDALAQALQAEANAAAALTAPELRDAREAAFDTKRDAAAAQREAVDMQEALREMSERRRRDDSRDPDGTVFLVDEQSGYVWIDIGQHSGVQIEQTFQVVRPNATLSSETQIAEIRVKELLRGTVARCRVDTLADASLYPRVGDLVKNPNFSARQYQKWMLVGTFGGQYTSHTRQQLTDLLRNTGFQVVNKMDPTVEAVIIGGNWLDDPEWQKAKELKLNIETYREEEVLHFLGVARPDRR